ncbi:hypothetical protein OROGR_026526 [Orobanche gracilis]
MWRRKCDCEQADTSFGVEAPHYETHIVLDHSTREGGGIGSVGQAGEIVIAKATVVGWGPTRRKAQLDFKKFHPARHVHVAAQVEALDNYTSMAMT